MKVELLGGDEGGLWEIGGGEVSPTPGLQVGEERGIGTFVPSNPCQKENPNEKKIITWKVYMSFPQFLSSV